MPEYVTIKEQIERRTYLKGRFTGKFLGYLDLVNSDIKHENFYDLEVISGEIFVNKSDFLTWKEGDEFEEFAGVEKFLTKLPNSLPCTVSYEDGNVKNFIVHLNQPKLANYELSNQLYEGNKLFATIEGEISGYLKHFDEEEKQVEVVPPEPELPKETTSLFSQVGKSGFEFESGRANVTTNVARRGCIGNIGVTDWDGCANAFASVVGILFALYGTIAIIIFIFSIIGKIFIASSAIILLVTVNVFLPLLIVGSILFIFVKLQHNLSWIWKVIFRVIIAFLILFFCLIRFLH